MKNVSDPSSATRSKYRLLISCGLLLIAFLAFIRFGPGQRSTPTLLRYGTVPAFSLTERSGRTVTEKDLRGKIWVADFIFTTCPGPCPLITQGLARLQTRLTDDPRLQLVTFTVDPETDTPAVLGAYAERFHANPTRWWFLTGPKQALYALIQNGFYQVVQDNHGRPLDPGEFVVTHSTRLMLVDPQGQIRGFFDGVGADDREPLLAAIAALEREKS